MRAMTGITYVNEMNDTSDTIMLGRYGKSSASTSRMLTPLISMMRSLPAMRGSKLAVPHVKRDRMRGTASQKHVAETAGGRADVEAIESFRGTQARLGEHVERADQLVGSTGDVIVSQIGIKRVGGRDLSDALDATVPFTRPCRIRSAVVLWSDYP